MTFEFELQVAFEMEEEKRRYCEANNKKFFSISEHKLLKNKSELLSREETLRRELTYSNGCNTDVILFDSNGKDGYSSVCFGLVSTTRNHIVMKTKNDVAVVVLAYAKARIGQFFRLMCSCISSRLAGASIKLLMTDTDSVANVVRLHILLKRNKLTKKMIFNNEQHKKATLNRLGE